MEKGLIFFIMIFWLVAKPALAFDKIYCEGDPKNWTLQHPQAKSAVLLSKDNQNFSLPEEASDLLLLKDEEGNIVLKIYPWNSLHIQPEVNTQKNFSVKATETTNGFSLEIKPLKGNLVRIINCIFTF